MFSFLGVIASLGVKEVREVKANSFTFLELRSYHFASLR